MGKSTVLLLMDSVAWIEFQDMAHIAILLMIER